jgi:hypothetical protein
MGPEFGVDVFEKSSETLPGVDSEFLSYPARSLVTIPTETSLLPIKMLLITKCMTQLQVFYL